MSVSEPAMSPTPSEPLSDLDHGPQPAIANDYRQYLASLPFHVSVDDPSALSVTLPPVTNSHRTRTEYPSGGYSLSIDSVHISTRASTVTVHASVHPPSPGAITTCAFEAPRGRLSLRVPAAYQYRWCVEGERVEVRPSPPVSRSPSPVFCPRSLSPASHRNSPTPSQ